MRRRRRTRVSSCVILGVLGRLELALGNLEAAGDCLRELPGRLQASGDERSHAARSGPTRSRRLSPSASSTRPAPTSKTTSATPAAAEPAGAGGCAALPRPASRGRGRHWRAPFAAFERALADRLDPPCLFERGRTLLWLGAVRRQAQQKKAAREALEQALAIFEELGARLWAEKARAELTRISGRRAAARS